MNKYFGDFSSREDVAMEFEQIVSGNRWNDEIPRVVREDFPKEEEILLAGYYYRDYEGSAYVLFERDGRLFEVEAGHCSCYGLEGSWEPDETTWKQLQDRRLSGFPEEFTQRLKELVDAHRN